jgi:hypothetical protein
MEVNNMTTERKQFTEASGDFSIYGVVRFTTYMMSSVALYMENFQIAAIAFGFGATLGFIRRVARIWE